jgi:hypothetical protein
MFSRWRQENFFGYMRHRYALDALDAYTSVPDDPDRTVPNFDKPPTQARAADAEAAMAAYNAEFAMALLLTAHYPRADDEARTLLRDIFTAPADLHATGGQLHVRIHPLSAPRRTRALPPTSSERQQSTAASP